MATPKRKKRQVLPRRWDAFQDAAVRRHNTSVGRLIWHWNRLHAIFAEAFVKLITPDDSGLGLSVWHAILADSGQRDMLESAMAYCEETKSNRASRAFEALEWMLRVVDELAHHRNDLAHTPMSQSIDFISREFIVVPVLMSKPQSAVRLSRPELRKFHALLQGDLIQLYHYGKRALDELDYPGIGAWPKTPLPLSVPRGKVPLTRSQSNRQQKLQLLKQQQNKRLGKPQDRKRAEAARRAALIAAAKARG